MEGIYCRSMATLAAPLASCSPRCLQVSSVMSPSVRHFQRISFATRAEFSNDPPRGQMQRQQSRPRPGSYDYPPQQFSGSGPPPSRYPPPDEQDPPPPENNGISNITKAFVAGAFILGMGAGIWFDSEVTFEPNNVASTVLVDNKTPNSEVCMANGYSSMVFDERVFVSFNPFNVYVAQPEVKPGCVLRRANFNVLESRNLVDSQQVQACKRNMNTFAFVGDLAGSPQVSCVYHSEEAENQFLRNPPKAVSAAAAAVTGEAEPFVPLQ